jgi:hypothetical protein
MRELKRSNAVAIGLGTAAFVVLKLIAPDDLVVWIVISCGIAAVLALWLRSGRHGR